MGNAAGLVSDGREGFLFGCVWRAAHALREKVELTAEGLADAAWELFSDPTRGAVLDDGRWRRADVAHRAKLTVRRLDAGTVTLEQAAPEDPAAEPVAPTYSAVPIPVGEARAAVRTAINKHQVPAGQLTLHADRGAPMKASGHSPSPLSVVEPKL